MRSELLPPRHPDFWLRVRDLHPGSSDYETDEIAASLTRKTGEEGWFVDALAPWRFKGERYLPHKLFVVGQTKIETNVRVTLSRLASSTT